MKANDILLAYDHYCNMWWFLQVTKVTEKSVTMRRIRANRLAGTPRVNDFLEDERPITKRHQGDGHIHLGGWQGAEMWDGRPLQIVTPWGINNDLY